MSETVVVRGRLAKRVREEAEKLGVSVDEYLAELLSQSLDPKSKALEYIEVARDLLAEAREELRRGSVRHAAEKTWGAAALSVKAYAYWREGRRLVSRGELWEYKERIAEELGEWVREAWMMASSMHTCFYEGWCTERDVEAVLKYVEKLVEEVKSRVKKENKRYT